MLSTRTCGQPWKPPAARRRLAVGCVLAVAASAGIFALADGPRASGGVSFAVIGDSGTGKPTQLAIANAMAAHKERDPFEFVVMLGDNIYGGIKGRRSFEQRFEKPYRTLLDQGVKFYAVLGNHGNSKAELNYEGFNMEGRRYYTFTRGDGLLQFFALHSSRMDAAQIEWLEKELAASTAKWKIAMLHHPIYSSARKHGPNTRLRRAIEPLLIKYKVNVVLAGHEHVYERLKPHQGVHYFISGAAGYVRNGDSRRSHPDYAAGYDEDCHFMVFDVRADSLRFQAVNAKGDVVDSGTIAAGAGEGDK